MPDAPTPRRTRLAAAAGLLGASAVTALLLGIGPAPSALQLAGASSDDSADDISGNCDEAEHAGDPECAGTPTTDGTDGTTSSTVDDTTSTTAGGGGGGGAPADDVRSLDAAGAGTVIYAVEGGSLRLVAATPASGWAVEVEQSAGREVEVDFRSGTKRVQVNVELEDGQARERVRFRDDADDTDVRTENGVVDDDSSNSGPGSGDDDDPTEVDDDHSGSGHDGSDDDEVDDDRSGSSSGPG